MALSRYQPPHDLLAEIRALLVKPDLHVFDVAILKAGALENYFGLCADHLVTGTEHQGQMARLDLFDAAVGAVLDGAEAKDELRRLQAALA